MKPARFSLLLQAICKEKPCELARFLLERVVAVSFWYLLSFLFFTSTSFAASTGDIIINEIEYNPQQAGDDSAYEWFELYNKTVSDLVLSNWTIGDNNKTETIPTVTIPALGFKVFAASGSFLINYPNLAGQAIYWSDLTIGNGLSNSGDRLVLKDDLGNVIDRISWGTDKTVLDPSIKAVSDGYSVERSPFGLDTDKASDFIDQDDPSPGTGFIPSPTPSPTPTTLPTPTLTPSPTTTPTATPIPTVTPTPTVTKEIQFNVPSEVTIGQSFNISVSLSSFSVNTLYYIKALVGKDTSSLTDGKTLGSDNSTWLAWNGSWSKMPTVQTNSLGEGSTTIQAKTDDDIFAGVYKIVVRIKEADGSESVDSPSQQVTISVLTDIPTVTPLPTPTDVSNKSNKTNQINIIKDTIKNLKNLEKGTVIETEGWVSAPPNFLGKNVFYLTDGESGIKVSSKSLPNLTLGQKVHVASTIEESYDEKYIKTDNISIIEETKKILKPKKVRGNQISEDLEGSLLQFNGRIIETSGSSFWLNDGFGSLRIYVKSSTGIKLPRKKVGDYARIIGILSQWGLDEEEKPNYRLLPRLQTDVLISELPIGGVGGSVLGAVSTLPKTGYNLYEVPLAIWSEIILPRLKVCFRDSPSFSPC